MFIAYNKVRMHDTDMAGLLYFARQFRFAHDALEDLFEAEGMNFKDLFGQNQYVFVIVHAEADYLMRLHVGDRLEVHLSIERIGETSISFVYNIYRNLHELVGTAKTIHVALDSQTRKKVAIPDDLRQKFTNYLVKD